jgi:hypothetical protein
MKIKNNCFQLILLFIFSISRQKSMFAVLHSDINSQAWPPSFNWPALLQKSVDQQKSKMELKIKV